MWPVAAGAAVLTGGIVLAAPLMAAAAIAVGQAQQTLSDKVPTEYRAALSAAAATCPQIPPGIFAAQIEVESSWNPTAISRAGAQGIAQFMPGTWQTWGGDFDGDGDGSPFDPQDAMQAQVDFMCALHRQAADSGIDEDPLALALAGYNAGWGAVMVHGGIPPYPETLAYVPRILALAAAYNGPVIFTGPGDGQAVWPVLDPMPITNPFWNHERNLGGVNYALDHHTGVDFNSAGNDLGMPVMAIRAGVVVKTGYGTALGNEVVIEHADGLFTSYGHLDQIRTSVGKPVVAGEQIGTIGSSGCRSCAPHLHLELRRVRDWIANPALFLDPIPWIGLGQP